MIFICQISSFYRQDHVEYCLVHKMSQLLNNEKHYLYTIWLTLVMLPNYLNLGLLISEVGK